MPGFRIPMIQTGGAKNKYIFSSAFIRSTAFSFIFLLAMPASTDYKLRDYGFGSGGTDNSTDGTYSIMGITGEQSGDQAASAAYKIGPGLVFINQANVPVAPTFTNPSNYYNKLRLVINQSGNPDDTLFAVAISDDDFVTTRYVQSDNTVGASLGSEDYRNYVSWGGVGGVLVIGLSPNTTYKVKAKAIQGNFTETGYGPTATASTIGPTLSFSISSNTVSFGDLIPDTVNDSPQNITASFSTNGESGGKIYIYGINAGLYSTTAGHNIGAVSGNLAALPEGFGAQGVSATQTSGGPLTIEAPYDQGNDIVGITDLTIRGIFDSVAPITGGSGTFRFKAKPSSVTPAAADYSETLTVIAAGRF